MNSNQHKKKCGAAKRKNTYQKPKLTKHGSLNSQIATFRTLY